MTAFTIVTHSFLASDKHDREAWTTPFLSATHVSEKPAQIGGWATDWALVVPFNN